MKFQLEGAYKRGIFYAGFYCMLSLSINIIYSLYFYFNKCVVKIKKLIRKRLVLKFDKKRSKNNELLKLGFEPGSLLQRRVLLKFVVQPEL